MLDRVPLYPGRVKLTPVSGQEDVYDMVRADQPTQEGTPLNKASLLTDATAVLFGLGTDAVPDDILAAIRGPGAITATYPVADGQSIQAGAVVDIVNGQATSEIVENANTVTQVTSVSSMDYAVLTRLSDNYSVSVDIENGVVYVSVLDKSGSSVVIQTCYSGSGTVFASVARVSDERFVVGFIRSGTFYAIAGYFSGTSLSFGSVTTVASSYQGKIFFVSDLKAVAIFANSGGGTSSIVLSVAGTSISLGSATVVSSTATCAYSNMDAASLGSNYFCLCFADSSASNAGKAVVGTLNSNSFSWGSLLIFDSHSVSYLAVSYGSTGFVVSYVYYSSPSYYLNVMKINISGSSASSGTTITAYTGSSTPTPNSLSITSIGSSFVLVYALNTGFSNGKAIAVVINAANGFSLGEEFTFVTSTYYAVLYLQCAETLDSTILSTYVTRLSGSSNYTLCSTTLTVLGNKIAGSFTMASSQAIALQSGNAGDTIDVIYAGSVFADWVTQGQQITSNGVKGAGILDGVLQVVGADSPGIKIVTGSYVGTGKFGESNPNTLEFDSPPKIVWILGNQSGYLQCVQVFSNFPSTVFTPDANSTLWVLTFSQNTMTWYSTGNEGNQFNISGFTYHYAAIV